MTKKLIIAILIFFTCTSCGFKPLNQIEKNNYFVNNINSEGEKRVAYFLKEKILLLRYYLLKLLLEAFYLGARESN